MELINISNDMMSISSIFKKASSMLGLGFSDSLKPPPLDGEIIYCKNNVCVHPPAPLTLEVSHHPGYLTVKSQMDENSRPTLILTWIPNATLKKNPHSIENSPCRSRGVSPKISPRRTPKQEYSKSGFPISSPSTSISPRESISTSSEMYDHLGHGAVTHQNADEASTSSEASVGSQEDSRSLENWSHHTEDPNREKVGVSYKSQADSGFGPEELLTNSQSIQNNEKYMLKNSVQRNKVGINVNDLYIEKENKKNPELRQSSKLGGDVDLSSTESDSLTPEQQLAVMLQRNKLQKKPRERSASNRSVSVEMDGDNLVVVTEELDDDVIGHRKVDIIDHNINTNESKFETSSSQSTDLDGTSLSSDSTDPSPSRNRYQSMLAEMTGNSPSESRSAETDETTDTSHETLIDATKQSVDQNHIGHLAPDTLTRPDISVSRVRMSSSSSTTTSGPDSNPPSPFSSPHSSPSHETMYPSDSSSSSSSSLVKITHNITFPHNSITYSSTRQVKKSLKDQICGVFSVDLGQMRSLRLFYSDKECTHGQVVIASRESQYKILHFHHGGLEKLAEIFEDWSLFAQKQEKKAEGEKGYKQFMIVQPQLSDDQCHPEEGVFFMVTGDVWRQYMNDAGQIEDDFQLRKEIFFGGLDPSLRAEMWTFLLHYYPFDATFDEREQIRNDKYIEYHNIKKMRESMTEEEQCHFWRNIQCTVEKDVIRTDRSNPYYAGDDNPNIEILKNILLNYAVANPMLGYTQGMSDLLAPVLAETQNEADAFWCFDGLMQKTLFVSSPKDTDMDKQLNYLRELLRLMQPVFYAHLSRLGYDALELLFCHRWILLCFKREFPEVDALRVWESCWAHYQTDYFHLFICVAIIAIYGEDVTEQNLPEDEILLHFSSLAMHMNGDLVLRKARGMLHEFRRTPKLPCTLHGLCVLCGPGMWDSGHVPQMECIGKHADGICPYHSQPGSPV